MAARGLSASTLADLIGGISLGGLLIPEAVAYSSIAGLPSAFGITGAIVGPLAYAIIGRSRLAVVSATSGSAALLAAGIAHAAIPHASRVDSAIALTALVGLFLTVGAVLRITALASFISRAVLYGFGFGLAVTITIRQLPALLGIPSIGGTPWQVLRAIIIRAGEIHVPSLLAGAAVLLLLAVGRQLRFAAAGLVVIVASILAMRFGPADHFGIVATGPLTLELAALHMPAIAPRAWLRLAQFAAPIAIVILAESWATVRTLGAERGDPISPEREIAALGLANLASAALRGLPVGAGFSIGNASARAGTATRLGAIIAALAVAAVAFTIPGWVALMPQPVLAAIVIAALAHALSAKPIICLFRLGRDQWVAVTAAAGVLLFGIINGLLLAVALSVLGLLRRLAYPNVSELGRAGEHDFVDCAVHPEAKPVAGMIIIRPNAPLFFGNADTFLVEAGHRARATGAKTIVLSLEESDDLDSGAIESISDFDSAMKAQGRRLILARVHDRARAVLARGGLADLAASSTFSVDDAVRAANKSALKE
jgi:MFS superfamily sulfate permease-like transporter